MQDGQGPSGNPDARDLEQFGYRQQLRRSMGHFSSFAVAFSLISVFTGVFANFSHGFRLVSGALPWSWLVVLAGQLLSRLQENGHAGAVDFMDRVGLRYHPADLGIRREDLAAALGNLRRYVEGRRDLWYTVLQEREITPAWIDEALATLQF